MAVVSADGRLIGSVGDPTAVTYLQSAAKPFQLAPFVASGRFDEFDLGDEELALMAASHSGEDRHVRTVQTILRIGGLSRSVLQCGVHPPFDVETAQRLVRDGEPPTELRNNCSGKHAGMALFAKASGWDVDTYWQPDHPVQRLALETVAALSDTPVDQVQTATDGCGVLAFAIPLHGLALAYARLADPSGLTDAPLRSALARIRDVMRAHPELIGGERRAFDTALMRALAGRVVAKGGAEGVRAVAVLAGGLGIAVKIEDGDGAHRAGAAVVCETLRQLGVAGERELTELAPYAAPSVWDLGRREVVGQIRAAFRLAEVR